ncbi:MAG: hypothetical protein JW862_11945, partial [Anaerolineales bacterium]|nr:hypothetical protein [Anaerolineales bacterium]
MRKGLINTGVMEQNTSPEQFTTWDARLPWTRWRKRKDRWASNLMAWLTLAAAGLAPLMALALYLRARPILHVYPLKELLLSTNWAPLRGQFGFYPF